MVTNLSNFTDVLGGDDFENSPPISLSNASETENEELHRNTVVGHSAISRPIRGTGRNGEFRSVEEIDQKYKHIFSYPYFNLVQSRVIDDALYSDKSIVVCAPTGSGKTVIFEMAIVQLLMEMDDNQWQGDFKIIYMAPVKSLCTERLTEWYPKFTKLGHLCIEVTGDTDVDFQRLEPYKIIITTPEKWDMLTRRWRDHRGLVELIKLFLIDEVHILNDQTRGPVLEAVVSRMKTIQESAQSAYRNEQLTKQYQANSSQNDLLSNNNQDLVPIRNKGKDLCPKIRFVAVSATVSNPEDVAEWLGTVEKSAVFYKFGDETRPVKLRRVVEGYPCADGTSIFKFDIVLSYKLWPIIQKYNDGKPTLIFCNTRKSVTMTAETLSKELTVRFSSEQKAKLVTLASTLKNKKLQSLILSGVGCHHAGLLYEERVNIENSFRNRELPILITTTTLAMGVNLPAHLVIIKNTKQYVNGAYQDYSISTVLQMVGRAGRPQYDTEATAVIMTTLKDKPRYQSLVGGSEPLQSYLHKRIAENLNSEAALSTVTDVAQCVQWLRSTFLYVRAGKDPRRYLGLPHNAPAQHITKKIEELCVKAMNGLATSGLITMDESSCIQSTEAGRLMSVYYLDVETMKQIMKIKGDETLDQLLWLVCESHELSDNHLRMDERRILNSLNRNTKAATIRFPMKGKITTRQMKLNCIIQSVLGCLQIPDPSLHQEAMKIMRIAERVCKCLLAYVIRPDLISTGPQYFSAVQNAITLNKCISSHLWENSPYVSKQLRGIGPTFSTLLATAGKTTFILLEESHPRDLERIMNKGPPAGNIIRKQIALLPKYQLTATPIDTNTVRFNLMLLNQTFLAENIDNLTAGVNHKSYIVVGDTDNHLLLLTSFKDKDLIGMYDGSISHEITRQSGNEHTIQCHCISTVFVGIDIQCEYVFKEIEPLIIKDVMSSYPPFEGEIPETPKFIQPNIADIFKKRKRNSNIDLTQSKEKKRRDCALIEKFKQVKDSFELTSKELRGNLNQTAKLSSSLIHEFNNNSINTTYSNEKNSLKDLKSFDNEIMSPNIDNIEDVDFDADDTICDEEFNNILSNIEKEIHRKSNTCDSKGSIAQEPKTEHDKKNSKSNNDFEKRGFHVPFRNKKLKTTKSNYNFIDEIEKKYSNSEDEIERSESNKGLPDSIKTYVSKYLENQASNKKNIENTMINLTENDNYEERDKCATNNSKAPLLKCQDTGNLQSTAGINFFVNRHQKDDFSCKSPRLSSRFAHLTEATTDDNTQYNDVIINDLTTNDLDIIEIDDDLDEEVTQKVISLASSIERTPDDIHKNNQTKNYDDLVSDQSCIQNCMEINELPEISFFQATKSMEQSIPHTQSLSPNLTKPNECIETPKQLSDCNLQTLSKQNPKHDIVFDENKDVSQDCNKSTECYLEEGINRSTNIENKNRNNVISNTGDTFIHKYSFTHTDINFCSKDLPDRKIHVVKKVRIDLDVTEIISKPVSLTTKSNDEIIYLQAGSPQTVDHLNKRESASKQTIFPELAIEKHDKLLQNTPAQQSSLTTFCKDLQLKKNVESNFTERVHKSPIYNNNKNADNLRNITENTKMEITEQTENCIEVKHIYESNVESNNKDNTVEERASVANILHKYSKLLQSKSLSNAGTETSKVTEKASQQVIVRDCQIEKPKRCYKISDIQNDRVSLPDGISQIISPYSKTSENFVNDDISESNEPNIKSKNDYLTICDRFKDFNKTKPISSDPDQSPELPNINNDISEFKSPTLTNIQLNLFDDFKIEPAVLDPKTLLQNVNKEFLSDLIVPPPPGFTEDNSNLSVDLDCNSDNNESNDSFSPLLNDDQDEINSSALKLNNFDYLSENYDNVQYFPNTSCPKPYIDYADSPVGYNPNTNNSVDDIQKTLHEVDLTPTKEVETWTLSRDDTYQEPRQRIPTFNISQNISRSQPVNNVQRLQSFKYKPKSQLPRSNLQRPYFKRNWPYVRRL